MSRAIDCMIDSTARPTRNASLSITALSTSDHARGLERRVAKGLEKERYRALSAPIYRYDPVLRRHGQFAWLLRRRENDLATDHGHDYSRLGEVSSSGGEYVLRQDGEVGFFSVFQRPQSIL
jgi:hypothetical protein